MTVRTGAGGMLAVCIALLASGAATAQDAGEDPDSSADSGAIEEIIVTATRREQSLQDVSLSISALGERQLENMGADSFVDYARAVPGVSFIDRGPGADYRVTVLGLRRWIHRVRRDGVACVSHGRHVYGYAEGDR